MAESQPLRILIVDDHPMVRRGLAAFLKGSSGLQFVGEAGDGQEALRLCDQFQPDVILMDLVMPMMSGAAATRAIRAKCPQVQVVVLTSFQEKELVREALEAGAISYLLKNVTADELAGAIRAAWAGRSTLAPEAMQALVQNASQGPTPGMDLTAREREVLAHLAIGPRHLRVGQDARIRRRRVAPAQLLVPVEPRLGGCGRLGGGAPRHRLEGFADGGHRQARGWRCAAE